MPLYDYESDRALKRSQSDVERANPSLVCPITAELFRDPVLCVGDGYTYEREAAEKWFADGKTTSPMTGAELPESQRRLVPNFNVRTRADQARGGAPQDGIRVNDFSVHVEDQSANDSGSGMPRSGSFSALDPPSPAEPAEPSAPNESAGSDAKTRRSGLIGTLRAGVAGKAREDRNQRDASRAVPYDGSHVYVISSDGKYLTDPGAQFVSLRATDRPVTGSEWIFKKSGERVAFKSAAALIGEYDHAHFNNHGHGRVEMWTKGGDAGHFTLHVDSGGGPLVKIETFGGKYLTHEGGNVFGRDGGLKWRIVPVSERKDGTNGASSSSGGAGSSRSGSSAKAASPSKGQSLMDWVRGYRGANGGPRQDQLGAYSWFDGNGWGKSRPLHRAAMRGEVKTIRSLCRGGRDPNEKMAEWFDSEPLGWAASLGHLDSVRALIELGADPFRPANKAGNTPMSDAQRERHQHVIRFLEEYEQRAKGLPTLSPAEVQKLTPGNLKIHEARYGWAGDIWGVTPSSNKSGSGAKDVTDIVRRLVHDDELNINPRCEPQYMNRTFWPETASGPAIARKLGVRYSYGDGPTKEETTHAVPNETVCLRVTRAKYAGAAVAPTAPAATGKRFPPINPSLNGELNNCARNTNDTGRLRDLVARGADLTSTNGAPWHHTPMHQSAYHNRPDMVKTLMELCAERGVLERVLATGSNPCGRGGSGTPMDLARGGGHHRCVEILAGAHSGPTTQTMSRDLPPGIHSAYDLQGCWGCVCWPFFGACETKRAEGPDTLRHTGVCLPFCLPYSDVWERESQSNTFRKRGADDRLTYPGDNPGCICFGPGVSWRWCK